MDRGAWWTIACGVTKVRHNLETENTNEPNKIGWRYKPKLNAYVCCVLQTKKGPAISKECNNLKMTKILVRWWAAVCGVPQSRTRLKWLSRSSSNVCLVQSVPWEGSTNVSPPSITAARSLPHNLNGYSVSGMNLGARASEGISGVWWVIHSEPSTRSLLKELCHQSLGFCLQSLWQHLNTKTQVKEQRPWQSTIGEKRRKAGHRWVLPWALGVFYSDTSVLNCVCLWGIRFQGSACNWV